MGPLIIYAIDMHYSWYESVTDCAYALEALGGDPATAYHVCAQADFYAVTP
jgi:hypothetical protein